VERRGTKIETESGKPDYRQAGSSKKRKKILKMRKNEH
jgi:hypothetical protein